MRKSHPPPPFFHFFLLLFFKSQPLVKARQPRYNSRASSFSLCDSHERWFCVWVRERAYVCEWVTAVDLYNSRDQEHSSLKNTGTVQPFLLFFIFAMLFAAAAVCLYHTVSF